MPKQTFYNLSNDKQELLLKIAKEEFSNNLFNEVSINKIIKDANISRGSFYTYFDDKEDLYHYLIKTVHESLLNVIRETIKKNNGVLKESFIDLFDLITKNCTNDNLFMQKIFLNANYKNEDQVFMKTCFNSKQTFLDEIISEIKNKDIKKNIDKKVLIKLHFMIMTHNIVQFIKNKDIKDTIKEEYIEALEILEAGYKEETC